MKSIIQIVCGGFLLLSFAYATENKNTKQNLTQPKIEIKGDSFVIVDSSCQSNLKKSLLTNLQSKDSQISKLEDCNTENHIRQN